MSRISSIIGYLILALMMVYFSVTWFIEGKIESALLRVSAWSDSVEGVSFQDLNFSLLSGDLEVEQLEIERLDPFSDISADRAVIGISWNDRFRFLLEKDFSPLSLQGMEIELNGLRMTERNVSVWTAQYAKLNLAGDLEEAVISFLKERSTRKGFKASFDIQKANIVPPPEVSSLLPVSQFIFPVENLKVESVFDPGINTLRSDIFFSKKDTSENHLSLTVIFDDKRRDILLPKRAILDVNSTAIAHSRRFLINDDGNELAMDRVRVNGFIEFGYVLQNKKGTWTPDRVKARIGLTRPVLYPSTRFMRQYGAFLQTFGFENGFAQFDSLGGNLHFESGVFRLDRTKVYADWMEAEIRLQSSLFENRGFDAPIQTGSLTITKLSAPITAGIRFVERQTQKKLFRADGTLQLELSGELNAPKIKGLF